MSDAIKIQKTFNIPKRPDVEKQKAQLKEAAEMYEQHFLREMVKAMRDTVKPGMNEPSFGEKIYQGQLDSQYVEQWSKKGGVGFADMIYNQMSERYFPKAGVHPLQKPQGPLPVNPTEPIRVRTVEPGSAYLLESKPGQNEVKNPWEGKVGQVLADENIGNVMRIDHKNGLTSRIQFVGQLDAIKVGQDLEAGQKLGVVSEKRPQVAWKVT